MWNITGRKLRQPCVYILLKFQNSDDNESSRSAREKAKRDLSKQLGSSSDSEYDDQDSTYGPTTRRAWSDYCSTKGKSSQSEEECNSKVRTASRILFVDWFDCDQRMGSVSRRSCDGRYRAGSKDKGISSNRRQDRRLAEAGWRRANQRRRLKSTGWIYYTTKLFSAPLPRVFIFWKNVWCTCLSCFWSSSYREETATSSGLCRPTVDGIEYGARSQWTWYTSSTS